MSSPSPRKREAGPAEIRALIDRRWQSLDKPGVLAVRPGYEVTNGWFTGRPAVVVAVARKLTPAKESEELPGEIEGVPVDVRQASPQKRLEIENPAAYSAELRLSPDVGSVAHFADERSLVTPAAPAIASAHAELATIQKPEIPYSGPAGVSLATVTDSMTVTVGASPDAGWTVLKPFLEQTEASLTVGMYDCTSARITTALDGAASGKKLALTLDHPPTDAEADQTDETTVGHLKAALGARLEQAWALTRLDPLATSWIYPTAYHIKVAVRDGLSMWLSSGNWNNSNQPDIDPVKDGPKSPAAAEARHRDRDWHVIIDHPALAGTFQAFLVHDLNTAAGHNQPTPAPGLPLPPPPLPQAETPAFKNFFAPATLSGTFTVTPVLTPDPTVYTKAVLDLISSASTSLYLQYQYIELPRVIDDTTADYVALIDAVIAKQKAGVDVRIICSQYESLDYLEQLITRGLDVMNRVKIQNHVHNKGIIVDGKSVLVSSQNWSADGVLHNRDAGVIIADDDGRAGTYFQKVFLHDWAHLARQHQSH